MKEKVVFLCFFCIIWVILSSDNLNVFQKKATSLKVITKKGLYMQFQTPISSPH